MADQILKPYVILKCAISIDGYLDDASNERLILSSPEDWERVDAIRASCDAVLVGAVTVRLDNPQLLIRSEQYRAERVAKGLPEHPTKVVLTNTGDLDPASYFFTTGEVLKLVYTRAGAADRQHEQLKDVAEVIIAGDHQVDLQILLSDLAARGIQRLLVEGGSKVGSEFLSAGLVDELQLSVAPFFVEQPAAPRFAPPTVAGHTMNKRMELVSVEKLGDTALLTWRIKKTE